MKRTIILIIVLSCMAFAQEKRQTKKISRDEYIVQLKMQLDQLDRQYQLLRTDYLAQLKVLEASDADSITVALPDSVK